MLLTNRLPTHFDPWRVMRAIEQQWNQNLGEWFESAAQAMGAAPFRLWVRDGAAVVEFDLPGACPDGIQVSVLRNLLTIDVAPEQPSEEAAEFLLRERTAHPRREVRLPFAADPQRTEASYVHGVLRVTVHQPEADRPAQISVTGG